MAGGRQPVRKAVCGGGGELWRAAARRRGAAPRARVAAWGGLAGQRPGRRAGRRGDGVRAARRPAAGRRAPRCCAGAAGRWTAWPSANCPPTRTSSRFPTRHYCRPVHEVAGWETKLASVFDRLLALDTPACLMPDPERDGASLRPSAALLYTLARPGRTGLPGAHPHDRLRRAPAPRRLDHLRRLPRCARRTTAPPEQPRPRRKRAHACRAGGRACAVPVGGNGRGEIGRIGRIGQIRQVR